MCNVDFAPLYRSTVGFDQIANLMDRVLTAEAAQPNYPPYNIQKFEDEAKTYLHRGIATRAFERRFHLADHVIVTGGTHADGMLHITTERQVPDALKSRQVQIASDVRIMGKDVVDAAAVN